MGPTRIRAAVVGTGFMGRVHVEALKRLGSVDVAAVVGSAREKAAALADAFGVDTATDNLDSVLRDPSIDAVHICTPNVRHFDAARASVEAVKHVLCEKPLARTRAEAAALVELATKKGVRHATCYHLRCYPLVQQMRALCVSGELGETLVVQGAYSQDWLLYDTDLRSRAGEAPGESGLGPGQDGEHWGPGTVWREKPWNARDVSSGNSR